MTDFAGLAAWGLIAGIAVGVILHFNMPSGRRADVIRWCLSVGGLSVLLIATMTVAGVNIPLKSVLGLGFIGFPAIVGGVALLILGRFNARP